MDTGRSSVDSRVDGDMMDEQTGGWLGRWLDDTCLMDG